MKLACDKLVNHGKKPGGAEWSCNSGRYPTIDEIDSIKRCLNILDCHSNWRVPTGATGGIALGAPNGCNCVWNNGWCGQPSIETNCGRACGDHTQYHICVKV